MVRITHVLMIAHSCSICVLCVFPSLTSFPSRALSHVICRFRVVLHGLRSSPHVTFAKVHSQSICLTVSMTPSLHSKHNVCAGVAQWILFEPTGRAFRIILRIRSRRVGAKTLSIVVSHFQSMRAGVPPRRMRLREGGAGSVAVISLSIALLLHFVNGDVPSFSGHQSMSRGWSVVVVLCIHIRFVFAHSALISLIRVRHAERGTMCSIWWTDRYTVTDVYN